MTADQPLFLRLLLEADGVPLYRSEAYHQLAEDDPRRLASMQRAADCWFTEGQADAIAGRLNEEDQQTRARLRAMSGDLSDAANWHAVAAELTYDEVRRRCDTAIHRAS